ncbi:MAG: hypothetical protein AAF669_02905 [Pseudomonadota bacterium]
MTETAYTAEADYCPAPVILGIHSNAFSAAVYSAGHAWITVTRGYNTQYYGLWPDNHRLTKNNGPGYDIRTGLEKNYTAAASRYYALSEDQAQSLESLLKRNVSWGITHNCSSWASAVVRFIIGEDVDADDFFGFETPRELSRNIILLEAKDPTTRQNPKSLIKPANSSSAK